MKTKESKGILQKIFDFNARAFSKLDKRIGKNGHKLIDHADKGCTALGKLNIPKFAYEVLRANMAAVPLVAQIPLAISLDLANLALAKVAPSAVHVPKP